MSRLGDLWAGRLPLAEAVWTWAVAIGALVNVLATGATFAALAADLPGGVALAIHLLPVPYNATCVVGVWRSAAHYSGPRYYADWARIGVVAWAIFLTTI